MTPPRFAPVGPTPWTSKGAVVLDAGDRPVAIATTWFDAEAIMAAVNAVALEEFDTMLAVKYERLKEAVGKFEQDLLNGVLEHGLPAGLHDHFVRRLEEMRNT